ncbi:MAG: hypothetical protein PHP12_02375 [Bacilli bacterium]|nr:hypothetical protein [Bacilli bacterium]
MRMDTMNKIKIFSRGAIVGAVILIAANKYSGNIIKLFEEDLKDEFPVPKYEESFKDTKTVEQYSFEYSGQMMTLQSDSLEIYSFDNDGNITVEHGEKVEVPIENNNYLLDEYISEKEAKVFKVLEVKDRIKNPYSVYVVFTWMEELYQEYLTRKPFDTLENRKEVIYKVCYDYIVSDEGYTMGKYEFSELDETIQNDIVDVYRNIYHMREKGKVKTESNISEFIDDKVKTLKYQLFKIGR